MINAISKVLTKIAKATVWVLCYFLPLNRNKVVFSSYYGRGYGDNPKYIAEELAKKNSGVRIVWLVKDKNEASTLPENIFPCKYNSIKSIFHLSTAKVWVDNCRKSFRYKKKRQLYMQTWHGFALKRIERDVEDALDKVYVKTAIKDSQNIDVIISDSKFMTGIYKKSFWYNGEVMEWGSPRNDMIIKGKAKTDENVRNFFGLKKGIKTVMYAPTFRNSKSLDAYSVDYNRLLSACEKKFGGEFVCLVRLHPNVVEKSNNIVFNEKTKNATYYPDMQELLSFADIVITDYSSLMFDFSLLFKPCFRFATDIESYINERNFYFEIDDLPFALCRNNDELEAEILGFNAKDYENKLSSFFEHIGMVRIGNASERCADWIIDKLK